MARLAPGAVIHRAAPVVADRPKCLACGKSLKPRYEDVYAESGEVVERTWTGGFGYCGEGDFCGINCAALFARHVRLQIKRMGTT